jgi:hypothetical protein
MAGMRRIFTLSVAWLAAAIVAAVVAWQGVGLVGDQVTDDRDAGMLTAAEIEEALGRAEGGIPIPPTTSPQTGDTTGAGATPPSTTAAGAGAGDTGSGTTPGRGTTPSRGTAPATGSGSGGPSPPAPAPAPAAIVRNYSVAGGSAAISFSPAEVRVLWARPASGWTAKTEPEGTGVRVEFESGDARSRIDAWWADGPQDRVEDDGSSGPGGGPGSADDGA